MKRNADMAEAIAKPKGLLMEQSPRIGDRRIPISETERQARVRLAACYRVFDYLGWTESIFNHITLRVPGPETVFLINPFGLSYCEVTASNLIAVDIQGRPVRPTEHPVNLAGFVTHSAIHQHVQAAHCVMHTHTTTGSAVACLADGLSHDSFYGAQLHDRVAYHDFEGVTVNADEQERMIASIGDKRVVILRNHGLLTWGETIEEAFMWLWVLQRACDIQIAAASAGRIGSLSAKVLAQTRLEAAARQPEVCKFAFDAWVRKVDAVDASYRN
jgi:ribulose-5-phosphate 4-epimerase/fuculose-1-phosphate aldolase